MVDGAVPPIAHRGGRRPVGRAQGAEQLQGGGDRSAIHRDDQIAGAEPGGSTSSLGTEHQHSRLLRQVVLETDEPRIVDINPLHVVSIERAGKPAA